MYETTIKFFPKQFTVGVLNAVLSVAALAGMLCPHNDIRSIEDSSLYREYRGTSPSLQHGVT